ncbi:hypothetical protein B7494_g4050 [Chlorociboria aeruginascens]|nr:hypothetical protein B7494_g4050 [Chlorociboria aeruginascens]
MRPLMVMLKIQTFKSLSAAPYLAQLTLHQGFKAFSSRSDSSHTTFDDADLDAARTWTSNKANTVWSMESLRQYVPKVIQSGLKLSRYYVVSSDSITINSDISRKQSENTDTTHEKLFGEITKIYKSCVPGITSPEQKKKIEALVGIDSFTQYFVTHRPSPPPYVTDIHINNDHTCVEEKWLKDIIAKYEELDDMFRVDFLSGIIFTGFPKIEFTPVAYKLLQTLGTRWIEVPGQT